MAPTLDGATQHDHPGHRTGPAPVAQWLGLFLAPAIFFVHLPAAYLLVLWLCGQPSSMLWLHLAAAIATGIAALGTWFARVAWTRAGAERPGDGGGPVPRTRLLAAAGLGTSGLLTLLLMAQWFAAFVTPPCQ